MAEAAVQGPTSSSTPKYYCHKCLTSVDLSPDLPDLTCPKCESGFVEELTQDLQTEHSHPRTPQMFLRGNDMTSIISGLLFNPEDDDEDTEDDDDDDDDDDIDLQRSSWPHERRVYRRSRGPRRTPMFSSAESRTLPRFIEHLLRGLTGSTASTRTDGSMPFLASFFHGDPRDYAWGADGLDNAITQLLNQWEGSGTPPASKEAIASLQSVDITQKYIDEEIQCSVCMDVFCLNDTVRNMPCQHLFHPDCITPWLQLHNTCPICRQSIDGSTVDDAAGILLPDSTDSSDDEDDENVDQSTSSTAVTDVSRSRLTGVDSEDLMTMDIDSMPSDTAVSWSTSHSRDDVDEPSRRTVSADMISSIELISARGSSSDDYDSD